MQEEKPKAKSKKIFKILGTTLAWFSLPIIGVLLLIITTQSSTIEQSLLILGNNSDIGITTLNGLLGIILILILIILTSKVRKKSYFFHLRIGLFIGLGIYGLILVFGIIMSFTPTTALNDPGTCSTPRQQYLTRQCSPPIMLLKAQVR